MNNNSHFPQWNPQKATRSKIFGGMDSAKSFKAFRSSSSGFISNRIVRNYVLIKSHYTCQICGDTEVEFLQVDHIISVFRCFYTDRIEHCNTLDNLQALCTGCNASKLP